MTTNVVILGAGFGGLELATRLSDEVADEVRVTLVDQSPWFMFGYSKLDVLFGKKSPEDVRLYYDRIVKPNVEFRQERVVAIDPERRHVETDAGSYDADVLVVALGADLDPGATPGLDAGGYEFYSPAGAERLRDVLASFDAGTVLVSVLGGFFKCPPAPNEAALMLHDHFTRRGVRDRVKIHLLSPLPMPIPVSAETSAAIISAFEERGIQYSPKTLVTSLDPARHVAILQNGESLPYDLFMGVPVHRAPQVVVDAGLTEDGWIPVDPATFATRFPGVYAVGDITSAPVPRAGVIAEGEAGTAADVIISNIRASGSPAPYAGIATCFIESGDDKVARVDLNFLSGPEVVARYQAPSLEIAAEKVEFGASRRARWFGY
jgi:sulfide:quinone oxidoreductase